MDNYPLPTRRRAAVDSAAERRPRAATTRSPPRTSVIALQIAAGGSAPCDASDTWTHADVSDDGRVTSLDALTILQAAASAIEL